MSTLFGQRKPARGRRRAISEVSPLAPQSGGPFGLRKINTRNLFLVLAFLVITGALTREPSRQMLNLDDIDERVRKGEDIVAPFSFQAVDLDKTDAVRKAAADAVPDYYRVDTEMVEEQLAALDKRLDLLEAERPRVVEAVIEALRNSTDTQERDAVVSAAVSAYAAKLATTPEWENKLDAAALSVWIKPDLDSLPVREFAPPQEGAAPTAETTPRPVLNLSGPDKDEATFNYSDRLGRLARESLRYILSQGVRVGTVPSDSPAHVLLSEKSVVDGAEQPKEMLLAELPDWDQVLEQRGDWLQTRARALVLDPEESSAWAKLLDNALKMAHLEVADVIRQDPAATSDARARAREQAGPVMKDIEANIIIQQNGVYWNPQSRSDVRTLALILADTAKPRQHLLTLICANAVLALLVLLFLHRAVGLLCEHSPIAPGTQFNLALLLICVTLLLGRVVLYFEPTGFILPVAAGAILMAILVNARIACMVSVLIAVLVSAQYGYEWRLLLVSLAMSLAGASSIFKVRRRSDMAGASIKATGAGLMAALVLALALDSLLSEVVLRRFVMIALNGGICLLVVPGLLSPLERLFRITTDIQLLEYSDLNNELLGQLAIKAPGTFAHSLMLGQLAEAAAERIGANGLLARVCAYYHDIGKMRRSEYFSENQTESNIHDKLSPRQSSRAIAAHVIQGAAMAREYHLPKPIADGILEHHGTCLIGYFYQQALEQRKHGDVNEADFRYPGPKPQRPETAILMICDASESGVRSIKNPNEERVREFIDKIIANRSADRQFDDCNLTLKQLNTIAEVITSRILTSLHTRVAYPDVKSEREVDNVVPISGGAE